MPRKYSYREFRAMGLCGDCGAEPLLGLARCDPCHARMRRSNQAWKRRHPENLRERQRRYHARLQAQMVQAYGGRCVCCGEEWVPYLELDHTNGDGKEHRGPGNNGSKVMYRLLRDAGWPRDRVQLLCANCHAAKTRRMACRPH